MARIPTRAAFLKELAGAGYKGSTDEPAVKQWCDQNFPDGFEDSAGDAFTFPQAWANQGETKRLKFSATEPKTPPTDEHGDDGDTDKAIAAKVEAAVASRLKRMGLDEPLRRPNLSDDRPERVTVKGTEQRIWETYAKCGHGFFSDYETAKAWHDWVSCTIISANKPHLTQWASEPSVKMNLAEVGQKRWQRFSEISTSRKAMSTTSPTGGAALVPEIFVPDLIKNVLEYGVARRLARVMQMPGPELILPRRTGGVTIYYPDEGSAPTETNPTYDNVRLSSKTGVGLSRASMQIMSDSGIGIAAELADEFARAVALQEDTMLLVGNGSSTHAGVTGFTNRITPSTSDGGWVADGGTSAGAHTIDHIHKLRGRLPQYARANAVFTVHAELAPLIFDRLSISVPGGLTWREFDGLGYVRTFLGRPVIENNVMASTNDGADGQIDVLYGDFGRAAKFGDHASMQVDFNDNRYWDTVQIGARCVVRHAITVHDVGSASAAGPVVALAQS